MAGWRLEHTYAELPQLFYADAAPTAVREPRLVAFNRPLATMLGLDPETLERPEGAAVFAGNTLPDWAQTVSKANPILYMVNAFRYGFLGHSDVDLGFSFAIMILSVVVLFAACVLLMNRGTGIRE